MKFHHMIGGISHRGSDPLVVGNFHRLRLIRIANHRRVHLRCLPNKVTATQLLDEQSLDQSLILAQAFDLSPGLGETGRLLNFKTIDFHGRVKPRKLNLMLDRKSLAPVSQLNVLRVHSYSQIKRQAAMFFASGASSTLTDSAHCTRSF